MPPEVCQLALPLPEKGKVIRLLGSWRSGTLLYTSVSTDIVSGLTFQKFLMQGHDYRNIRWLYKPKPGI